MRRLFKGNKKGQAGLDFSKAFLLGLFALAVVGVMVIIVLTQLGNVTGTTTTIDGTTNLVGYINETGFQLTPSSYLGYTITGAANQTIGNSLGNGTTILAGNYTVSATGLVTNATTTTWNNVTFNYTGTIRNNAGNTVNNVSTAIPSFFSNATTWLTLLSIVVIVLITIIIIRVFGGGRNETSL